MKIEALVRLLNLALTFVLGFLAKREQKSAQDERDQIEQNPADWYKSHFGSGLHEPTSTTSTEADKAAPDSSSNS